MRVVKLSIGLFLILVLWGNSYAEKGSSGTIYSFTMKTIDDSEKNFSDYKGKVLLIVNTASRCGFTPQLGSLEELYQRYKDKGLEILAFPANNFLGQEPGNNQEIKNFCYRKFNTTFTLFSKTSVKGADINPLYRYLTQESEFKGPISWNFNKFLVDPQGEVVARYESRVDPLSEEIIRKIEEILPDK